jgi:hypothetical protein
MTEELMLRLARGETLEGEEAQAALAELTSETPWRFGVQLALAYLREGRIDVAIEVLEQLQAKRDA